MEQILRDDDDKLKEAERFVRHYTATIGLTKKIALLPARLPANCHRFALDLQDEWLTTLHRMALDDEFIERCLGETTKADPYIARLMHVYRETRTTEHTRLRLSLLRIDYLLSHWKVGHAATFDDDLQMKLVEIVTSPAGFGLATKMSAFRTVHARMHALWADDCGLGSSENHQKSGRLMTDSDLAKCLAGGLSAAHRAYCERFASRRRNASAPQPVIVIVLADRAQVVGDMVTVETEIDGDIGVLYRTLDEITRQCSLRYGDLLYVGPYEVSVLYLSTDDRSFQSDEQWAARLLIERSLAVTCPDARDYLIATKKAQQVMSERDGAIEQFASSFDAASRLRQTFVAQFTLDDRAAVDRALREPHKFYLKPNRDGGGNNFIDEALRAKVKSLVGSAEAGAYVLMERIRPPTQWNCMCDTAATGDSASSICGETVDEFSYWGVLLTEGREVLRKESARELFVRTKLAGSVDCGVGKGYGALAMASVFTRIRILHFECHASA